jgi:hypothetical protein
LFSDLPLQQYTARQRLFSAAAAAAAAVVGGSDGQIQSAASSSSLAPKALQWKSYLNHIRNRQCHPVFSSGMLDARSQELLICRILTRNESACAEAHRQSRIANVSQRSKYWETVMVGKASDDILLLQASRGVQGVTKPLSELVAQISAAAAPATPVTAAVRDGALTDSGTAPVSAFSLAQI